jgi:hypothetical protein
MKALGLILSTLSIMLAGCAGKEEVFTPEMLGERTFNTLSTNNKEAFASYFITPEELHEEFIPEQQGFEDYYRAKYVYSTQNRFDSLRAEGKDRGVDWGIAKFTMVQYKVLKDKNIPQADIYVFFTSAADTFVLRLADCRPLIDRGWRLFDDVSFENFPFKK